jgi:hypothetical protein
LITPPLQAFWAVQQPDNYEARANLLWAASWALNSFCGSGQKQAASCHSMEHELSACYDLTHGLGLAILYPRWMRYLLEKDETVAADFAKFGANVLGCAPQTDAKQGALAAIEALETFLYDTLGLKSTLTACGIDDSRFAEMATGMNRTSVRRMDSITPSSIAYFSALVK